jgi:F-type H+-transporting ATPase subunit b
MEFSTILEGIGIDYKLLIFNIINFLVVVWLLQKLFFGKILSTIEERQKKLSEIMGAEDEAKNAKIQAANEREKILFKAKQESLEILRKTKTDNELLAASLASEAKETAEKIVSQSKIEAEKLKQDAEKESQEKSKDMILSLTKQLIDTEVSDKNLLQKVNTLINPIQ